MRYGTRLVAGAAALLTLAGCSSDGEKAVASASQQSPVGVSDMPVKLGDAFTIGAVKYTPEDVALYDDVGLASWYGSELAGSSTANGESFVQAGISAAHKTLPMPSYVEVTALDTGRTILVRINDRGPMTNDRLIDLSEGAARQLGIIDKGVTAVRVRRVNPPENEKAALRVGMPATVRMDTPESLLKVLRDKLARQTKPLAEAPKVEPMAPATKEPAKPAKPKVEAKPVPVKPAKTTQANSTAGATGQYGVQVAAFSSRANAETLAKKLGANVVPSSDGKLFRVRFGPFASEKEAQAALTDTRKRGYPQARLFRE